MRVETEMSRKGRGKAQPTSQTAQSRTGRGTRALRISAGSSSAGPRSTKFQRQSPDLVFNWIESVYEPKDVWQKLKELFEGKSRRLLAGLGRKFQNTRCGENGDIRAHLEKSSLSYVKSFHRSISDAKYVSVILPASNPPLTPLPTPMRRRTTRTSRGVCHADHRHPNGHQQRRKATPPQRQEQDITGKSVGQRAAGGKGRGR